jgi:hypothetical protein
MGLSCSWIAIKGASQADLLDAIGMETSDQKVIPGEQSTKFSFHSFPNGWSVLFSEDFDWGDHERVRDLSRFGSAIGCQFEDHVEMTSTAVGAKDGVELWRVHHFNTPKYRLDISAAPPSELEAIKAKFFRLQDEDGGEKSSVDYICEIPISLAKAITGYHPLEDDSDEMTYFTALKLLGAAEPEPYKRPGLFSLLFKPKRA